MTSSEGGGDRGPGVEVRDSGVRGQEFLSPFSSFEAELSTFLLPSRARRLFNQVVAAGGGDDLHVLHRVEHGKLTHRRPVAPQLVGENGLWDAIFTEQAHKKGLGCLGLSMFLKDDVEYGPGFVDRAPQPMPYPTDLDAHLVQMPPRTPLGSSVAQFFGEDGREFDVPLPQSFVADLNTALVEQFLTVTLAEREAVVEPQGVTDDAQGKTMAVRFLVSHSSPAYRG